MSRCLNYYVSDAAKVKNNTNLCKTRRTIIPSIHELEKGFELMSHIRI